MKKKILIVDDSEQIRDSLHLLLQGHGFEVTEANDGLEGLELTQSTSFDLIIVDVNMPRLNGLDMLEEVRKTSFNSATPSFVLTTESLKKFSERFRALGAKAWVVKPYHPERLMQVVNSTLGTAA